MDYEPISCALHAEYELAIMRRQKLRLTWSSDDIIHCAVIEPTDLRTQERQEFLIGRTQQGENVKIRLDHISRKEQA